MGAPGPAEGPAAAAPPRRLCLTSAGLATNARVRRILELAGYRTALGLPGPGDAAAVWGRSPTAWRGEWLAARRDAALVRIEDAFLRSVRPGRSGEPPLGLMLDLTGGVHFDASRPGALETHLATAPLDDAAQLARAEAGIARMRAAHLSKYSACDPGLEVPPPGYVLVVDQVRGDASIRHGGAGADSFARMLAAARADHPGRRIVVKAHPDAAHGRSGHFGPGETDARTTLVRAPVSPWRLIGGAAAVYAVTSQMGFEAVLAGHRPVLFGQPFYAGWGLTEDRAGAPARRGRRLSPAQLFAGAMLDLPLWYDPFRDRLCAFEDALDTIEAAARAWRDDRRGHVALGMRLWKRAHVRRFFGTAGRPVRFEDRAAAAAARAAREGCGVIAWAAREPAALAPACRAAGVTLARVEDGFLRSQGLGAKLVPAVSMALDDLGIHFDPSRESRLERLIAASPGLAPAEIARAARLIGRLRAAGLGKYGAGDGAAAGTGEAGAGAGLIGKAGAGAAGGPARRIVLVAGQVEDDAAVRLGCGAVRTNAALLAAARAAEPGATLVYKPHPDVEAGLRPGALSPAEAAPADAVLAGMGAAAALAQADAVWTMTSLLGFEALLRGRPVTCLGAPFYAGWGLTRDLGPVPARRRAVRGVTLEGLVHAALVAYPRYRDPLTGLPCPVEVAAERLAAPGAAPPPGVPLRLLAKAQGVLAAQSRLWR